MLHRWRFAVYPVQGPGMARWHKVKREPINIADLFKDVHVGQDVEHWWGLLACSSWVKCVQTCIGATSTAEKAVVSCQ